MALGDSSQSVEASRDKERYGLGLLEEYKKRHAPGYSLEPWLCEVTTLISETASVSILDYGCGDAQQYKTEKFHACWSEDKPKLYDPLTHTKDKPTTPFDGVICTDLFQRITPNKHAKICEELCFYATKFLFVVIPRNLRNDIEPLLKVRDGCRLEIR